MAQLTSGPARLGADALVGYGAPMRLAKPLATLGALYLELLELIELFLEALGDARAAGSARGGRAAAAR